jgi:hypothetical protein
MYKSSKKDRVGMIHRRIAGFDYMCSGNLRRRYAVCGTINCRCKGKPPKPHGPYFYWSRLIDGRIVQKVLSKDQARIVAEGIANRRRLKALLRDWEEETLRSIKTQDVRQ